MTSKKGTTSELIARVGEKELIVTTHVITKGVSYTVKIKDKSNGFDELVDAIEFWNKQC